MDLDGSHQQQRHWDLAAPGRISHADRNDSCPGAFYGLLGIVMCGEGVADYTRERWQS